MAQNCAFCYILLEEGKGVQREAGESPSVHKIA